MNTDIQHIRKILLYFLTPEDSTPPEWHGADLMHMDIKYFFRIGTAKLFFWFFIILTLVYILGRA